MTEWWVSQKKNWCTICRVWTGGHIQQILKHKNGRMHQEHEEKMLKDSRAREAERQKEEQDLKDRLFFIEQAAAKAMQEENWQPPSVAALSDDKDGISGPVKLANSGAVKRAQQAIEKANIEQTIETAKRRRENSSAKAADPAPDNYLGCPWGRFTDPNSGVYYYHNAATSESSWQEPEQFKAARVAHLASASAPATPAVLAETAGVISAPATRASSSDSVPKVSKAETAIAAAAARQIAAAVAQEGVAHEPPASARARTGIQQNFKAPGCGIACGGSSSSVPARLKAMTAADKAADEMVLRHYRKLDGEEECALDGTEATAPGSGSAFSKASSAAVSSTAIQQAPLVSPVSTPSGWVVCRDPNSGHVYYHNTSTKESTWTQPAEMSVDLSKPPPPPVKKPPGPPGRSGAGARGCDSLAGAWEEVKPENSMFEAPEEVAVAAQPEDAHEELPATHALTELRCEVMGRKGHWADEDRQLREKAPFEKKSNTGADVSECTSAPAFPLSRNKASGIRRRVED